jgi:hypothetical protein
MLTNKPALDNVNHAHICGLRLTLLPAAGGLIKAVAELVQANTCHTYIS